MNHMATPQGAVLAESVPLELLTFDLGDERYAVEACKVRQVRGIDPLTAIASGLKSVRLGINLGGVFVPIVDLRAMLNLGSAQCSRDTALILLEARGALAGLVVDRVVGMLDVSRDRFLPAPGAGTAFGAGDLAGMWVSGGRRLLLVDVERFVDRCDFIPTEDKIRAEH
jgi:purine-binding chemotaxis protein CheW